jgi:hypothetical protein
LAKSRAEPRAPESISACASLVAVLVGAIACSGSSGSGEPTAPGEVPSPPPADQRPGTLEVTVRSTGVDVPIAYSVRVDGGATLAAGAPDPFPATFAGLFAGDHIVQIFTPPNCSPTGPPVRTVTIPASGTVRLTFDVSCTALQGKLDYTLQIEGDLVAGPLLARFAPGQIFASYTVENVRLTLPAGILSGAGPDGRFSGSGCTYTEPGVDPNRENTWGRNAGTYQGRLNGFLLPTEGFVGGQSHIDFQGFLVKEDASTPPVFLNLAVNQFPAQPLKQSGASTALSFRNAQALTGFQSADGGADPCVRFTVTATPR